MVERQLAKAIVDLAIFLEVSGDDIVDPDAAVGAMEELANNLRLASPDVQTSLASQFLSLAPQYPGQEEFVRDLSEALGLEL